jgi:hypothetical protein
MADQKVDMTSLGDIIGAAIAQGITATQPAREPKEGDKEYVAMQEAQGWFDDFDGGVVVLQNAYEAQARGLSADVRFRAAHVKPGSYIRNRVKVTVENDGRIVRFSYPVKGDAMLMNRDYFSSFEDLVNKVWAEMHTPVAS